MPTVPELAKAVAVELDDEGRTPYQILREWVCRTPSVSANTLWYVYDATYGVMPIRDADESGRLAVRDRMLALAEVGERPAPILEPPRGET